MEFESRAWMEAVLSCLRDFYITQVGGCNPVWRLKVVNFRPKPVKLTGIFSYSHYYNRCNEPVYDAFQNSMKYLFICIIYIKI